MSHPPRVSVIVLTFNRQELLSETIQSILAQSFKDFELVVVDNHSNYDFFSLIESFNDKRIRGFQNANNGFLAVNRNFGIEQAKGEFIAFCDDDDLWDKEKLSRQVLVMDEKPEILLVGTNGSTFPKVRKNMLFFYRDKVIGLHYLLKKRMGVLLSSVMFRHSVVKEVGLFDLDPEILALEDFDYWLRILKYKDHSIYVIKDDLLKYRVHDANMLSSVDKESSRYKKLLKIFAKHPHAAAAYIDYYKKNMEYLTYLHTTYVRLYEGKMKLIEIMKDHQLKLKDKLLMLIKSTVLKLLTKA